MRISAAYGWDDGSSLEVLISDDLDSFDPNRLADMAVKARDTLRLAVGEQGRCVVEASARNDEATPQQRLPADTDGHNPPSVVR